jgi:hypothetical protein
MIPPTAEASATAEPEMPPNSVQVTTLTWPSPPRRCPTRPAAKLDQPLGDAAADHQIARIDEERDRHHREGVHARVDICWKTTTGGTSI